MVPALFRTGFAAFLLLWVEQHASGYSVLSHEAIIDGAWIDSIRPLLLARFPNTTTEQLREAHGYAYGGAIIQDAGYYPSGSHLFSDLAHYMRSGEFVLNLIREAHDVNEYAFALGSLAHYAADEQGHSMAVNPTVGRLFPKLRKKFGPVVTYEDNPSAHLKTEFAFDVVQVARGYYAPDAYRDFVGFAVSKPVLERAFQRTYCLDLRSLVSDEDRAFGTYRHVVSEIIPKATKIAWVMKRDEITKKLGGGRSAARRKFLFNLSRSSYEKRWGRDYEKPSFWDRFLALLMRIIPKIGPLRTLGFRTPDAQAEDAFMKSFDLALDEYRRLLKEVGANRLTELRELNLDTGKPSGAVPYWMADRARNEWVKQLNGSVCPAPAPVRPVTE